MEQLPHLATLAALLQQAPNAQYIIFSTNTQTSSTAEWNKLQRWITGIFSPTAHAQLSREIQEWNSSKVMILEEWRLFKKTTEKKLKKNSDFDKIWTRAHQILAGRFANWATKPRVWSEAHFRELEVLLSREGIWQRFLIK